VSLCLPGKCLLQLFGWPWLWLGFFMASLTKLSCKLGDSGSHRRGVSGGKRGVCVFPKNVSIASHNLGQSADYNSVVVGVISRGGPGCK
jgi:hypothetical protein